MPQSWILYDKGKVGTRSQCEGVASALDLSPQFIELSARFPWKFLPSQFWLNALHATTPKLAPPWPEIIIAAGRTTVAPCVAIKRKLKNDIKVIQIMDPRVDPENFDFVIAPQHDQLTGDNVIQTVGAIHPLTNESIEAEKRALMPHIDHLPRPYHVVLLGGQTRRHRFDALVLAEMVKQLREVVFETGGSVLITPSRRTDIEAVKALPRLLNGIPHFVSSSYYKGFLGVADQILVTSDSISMISEACFTGKPVYIYPLRGKPGKFDIFYQTFVNNGYAQIFRGRFIPFVPKKLDEMAALKSQIMTKSN